MLEHIIKISVKANNIKLKGKEIVVIKNSEQ
jgi:hypothetical protein